MLTSASSASSSLSASSVLSPSFSCPASSMLSACKSLEAFRKSQESRHGLTAGAAFFCFQGGSLLLEAFGLSSSFLAALPSAKASGSFSLPWLPFFSFVKETKGKGFLSYEKGKLSASASGASLSLPAGEGKRSHADINVPGEEAWLPEGLPSLEKLSSLALPSDAEGFPVEAFLRASAFCSDDASKEALNGVFLSESLRAFVATDGFTLYSASLSASSSSSPLAYGAWLPSWLASLVESATTKKERASASLWAFFFKGKAGQRAFRCWLPSSVMIMARWKETGSAFPAVDGLFPDPALASSSFSFYRESLERAFLPLEKALKGSADKPHACFFYDAEIGTLSMEAELFQKVGGSRFSPKLESLGSQEASLSIESASFLSDPRITEEGFYERPEAEQEGLLSVWKASRSFCLNASFLKRSLEAWKKEGSGKLKLSFSAGKALLFESPSSRLLIMPVIKRR